jgi:hypothetical protein
MGFDLNRLNLLVNNGIVKKKGELDELLESWRLDMNPPMSKVRFVFFVRMKVLDFERNINPVGFEEKMKVLDELDDIYFKQFQLSTDFDIKGKILPFGLTPDKLKERWDELSGYEHYFLTEHQYNFINDPRLTKVFRRLDELDLIDKVSFPKTKTTTLTLCLLLSEVKSKAMWSRVADELVTDLIVSLETMYASDVVIYKKARDFLKTIGLGNHVFIELMSRAEKAKTFHELFEFLPTLLNSFEVMVHSTLLDVKVDDELIEFVSTSIQTEDDVVGLKKLFDKRFGTSHYKCEFDEVFNHWREFFESSSFWTGQ